MTMEIDIKKYDKDFLMGLLEKMTQIRRFEDKAGQMYGLRKIGGFCHIYTGQEAVATGSVAAVDLKNDYVLTAYRDHGHALAVGMDPGVVMAELFGKITGCSRGKGGSMHMFDVDKNFYGGNGIVGAHIPLAAGVALKIKYNQQQGVVLCFFGDGAIHQGSFHETLNMASVWNLPVIYICENNMFGMGTDYRRVSAVTDFSQLAVSYGIWGEQVDGMDVLEVYERVKMNADSAREDSKPRLLEIKTYRYLGHSMSDPATYRTKDDVAEYKKQDPIIILRDRMTEAGLIADDQYEKMDKDAKDKARQAVEFAENSDPPGLETIYEDVLA